MRQLLPAMLIALMLVGCGSEITPEDQIRERVKEGEVAAEARERLKLAAMISEDYADDRNNKAEDIRRMIVGLITRYKQVHLLARVQSVTMENEQQGTAVVLMGMLSQQDDDILPLPMIRAELYRTELTWRKETTGWNLVKADWERAGPDDLLE